MREGEGGDNPRLPKGHYYFLWAKVCSHGNNSTPKTYLSNVVVCRKSPDLTNPARNLKPYAVNHIYTPSQGTLLHTHYTVVHTRHTRPIGILIKPQHNFNIHTLQQLPEYWYKWAVARDRQPIHFQALFAGPILWRLLQVLLEQLSWLIDIEPSVLYREVSFIERCH